MTLGTFRRLLHSMGPMDSAAPKAKFKYQSLDAGRGIAALAVVWHHSTGMLQTGDLWANSWYLSRFYGFALGVAYFFVLSGTVILLAHWRDLGRPAAAPQYLWKRAKRIYPIYWVALTLWMLLYGRQNTASLHQYLDGFLLLRTAGPAVPFLPVAWTLYHEVFFYLVFLVVIWNQRLGWVALSAWWVLAAFQYQPGPIDQAVSLSSVQLLFALGLGAAYLIRTRRVPLPGLLAVAGLILMLLAVIWSGHVGIVTVQAYLFSGVAAFLIIIGAAELEVRGQLRLPNALLFLGKASYSIYLFHLIAVVRLGRMFFRLNRHLPLPQPIWLGGIFLGSVTFGCLAYAYVERPLMQRVSAWGSRSAEPAAWKKPMGS